MELTKRQQEIQNAIASAFLMAETNKTFKKKLSEQPFSSIQEFIAFQVSEMEITDVFNLSNQIDVELTELQMETVTGGENGPKKFDDFISYVKRSYAIH